MAFEKESLAGKNAIVTGSSSGIGKGIALELARRGARVMVTGRNAVRTQETVAQIRALGGEAEGYVFDLCRDEAIEKFTKEDIPAFGGVDILVNNAGICVTRDFLDIPVEEMDATLNTNLRAPILLLQRVIRLMQAQKRGGSILIVSSVNATLPVPNQPVYSATKAGLVNLTKSLAYSFAADGIRVNCLAPGATLTAIEMPQEFIDRFTPMIPLHRFGLPEDMGYMAAFLVSDAASYITGATFDVDGGLLLRSDLKL